MKRILLALLITMMPPIMALPQWWNNIFHKKPTPAVVAWVRSASLWDASWGKKAIVCVGTGVSASLLTAAAFVAHSLIKR